MCPAHFVLALHPVTVALTAEAMKNLLLRSAQADVTILKHVHLCLPLLLGLKRIHDLVRVDRGELIGETLHELIPPVLLQVAIEGASLVPCFLVLFLIVLAEVPYYPSGTLVGVEAVIRMQPEDIGLVRLLKVGHIEGALVHVEVPLLLLELRIGALEVDHPITFCQVVTNHYHRKVTFLRETLDQVNQFRPRAVIDSFEFIKIVGIDM